MPSSRCDQRDDQPLSKATCAPSLLVAQAYDLNDPYHNDSCYGKEKCHDNSPFNITWNQTGCFGYCESVKTTNWYMGPIHPRAKKAVGTRLARVGAVVAYNKPGHANGPTISGCVLAGSKLTVTFNKTMLSGEAITINPYYKGDATVKGKAYPGLGSKMEVLTNASTFCMQLGGTGPGGCRDDGTGKPVPAVALGAEASGHPPKAPSYWVAVDIAVGAAGEVVLDLAKAGGVANAVRYAWTGDCCSENPPTYKKRPQTTIGQIVCLCHARSIVAEKDPHNRAVSVQLGPLPAGLLSDLRDDL